MVEDVGQRLQTQKRAFLVKTIYKANNKSEPFHCFEEQFNRQIQSHTFTDIVDRFEQNGAIDNKKQLDRLAVTRTGENPGAVVSIFSNHLTGSTRRAVSKPDIWRTSIIRRLSDLHLRSYCLRLVQQLQDDDPDQRVEF